MNEDSGAKFIVQSITDMIIGATILRIGAIRNDVFDVGLSDADIITIFLTPKGNQMIKTKLENEIRKECRIVSHDFEMSGWQHEKMKRVGDCLVYLYRPKH